MKMDNNQYAQFVKQRMPSSKSFKNVAAAFLIGGAICAAGQGIKLAFELWVTDQKAAAAWTSITLVFLGALLTGLHIYDRIAKHAGAGTIVPITGFANSITSPAMEFKSEGLVLGMAAKMFVVAGPVIVYGTVASVVYGVIYYFLK